MTQRRGGKTGKKRHGAVVFGKIRNVYGLLTACVSMAFAMAGMGCKRGDRQYRLLTLNMWN